MELASEPSEGKVLVIEPHYEARYLMREILRHQFNCTVFSAESVSDGLHLLKQEDFDVIISDTDEPCKMAIELMLELVKLKLNIPLVFYSNHDVPHYLFRNIEYPYSVINKPHHRRLVELLHDALGWKQKGFVSEEKNRGRV